MWQTIVLSPTYLVVGTLVLILVLLVSFVSTKRKVMKIR